MGIVVPAAGPVKPKKDSVELLLDGMQGPQPQRPRTTPQTDGESHAAYHAKHQVHAARTSPEDEPKVVVERPNLPQTTRIDRSRIQSVIDQADAMRRENEATAVLPQRVAPRLLVAIVAGLAVVMGLFVLLRLAFKHDADERPPVEARPAAVAPQVAPPPALPASAPPAPVPATAESSASVPPPDPSPAETSTAKPPPAARAWAPPAGKPRVPPKASASSPTVDLGDYQTQLH
jgi:hypothetical protein